MIDLATLERDRKFYYSARRLASQSMYPIRVGCIAAHNGKVLAGAFNTIRNPASNVPYGNATYHAEYNCISMVPDRLVSRITLYVARIDKSSKRMPSRPCDRCMVNIATRDIREIVYFDGQFIVKEKL